MDTTKVKKEFVEYKTNTTKVKQEIVEYTKINEYDKSKVRT